MSWGNITYQELESAWALCVLCALCALWAGGVPRAHINVLSMYSETTRFVGVDVGGTLMVHADWQVW